MDGKGFYTTYDLEQALQTKSNCSFTIYKAGDHTYVNTAKGRKIPPYMLPYAEQWTKEEVSTRWLSSDAIAKHMIIGDLIEWVKVYL